MTQPNTRFIFPKGKIKHPMQTVFDAPVASDSRRKRFDRRKTEQEVACFFRCLLLHAPLSSNDSNALQAFPLAFWVQMSQDGWIAHGPMLTNLQTTMPFLHLPIRLPVRLS